MELPGKCWACSDVLWHVVFAPGAAVFPLVTDEPNSTAVLPEGADVSRRPSAWCQRPNDSECSFSFVSLVLWRSSLRPDSDCMPKFKINKLRSSFCP